MFDGAGKWAIMYYPENSGWLCHEREYRDKV